MCMCAFVCFKANEFNGYFFEQQKIGRKIDQITHQFSAYSPSTFLQHRNNLASLTKKKKKKNSQEELQSKKSGRRIWWVGQPQHFCKPSGIMFNKAGLPPNV